MIDRFLAARALALLFAACLFLVSCEPTTVRSLRPDSAPVAQATDIAAFPWPPPPASALYAIPARLVVSLEGSTTLSDVGRKLTKALAEARYSKWSYSAVPRGFALVTQIEQIKDDGTPRPDPDRFSTDLPSLGSMSFVEFLKAMAKAPPGRYRVIVFIVTDVPLSQAGEKPTEDEAQRWLNAGVLQLPESIGRMTYDAQHYNTTALIYEFEKPSTTAPPVFVPNSRLLGDTHLERAGIWYRLTREP
jgi:hypothetical protein